MAAKYIEELAKEKERIMTNYNDTIEQVCADLRGHDLIPPPRGAWVMYADRIREVYNHERRKWEASIADQRSINKKLVDNIAEKDREIEKLKFDNMHLKSGQRMAGEVIIEQTNKVEAKDAEIAELRQRLKIAEDSLGEIAKDDMCGNREMAARALYDIRAIREEVKP